MINSNYGEGHSLIPRFHVVKDEPKRDSLLRGFLLIRMMRYVNAVGNLTKYTQFTLKTILNA